MKKAFTLIELIVVVGILAVLIGTLVAALSGGTDAARAARCLTNLKNLATACNSYAMASSCYPLAGSVELRGIDRDSGSSGEISQKFTEAPGSVTLTVEETERRMSAQSEKVSSPDAVIINLGTNDGGACGSEAYTDSETGAVYRMKKNEDGSLDGESLERFTTAAVDFLTKLRSLHGGARFLWVYGMLGADMEEAILAAIRRYQSLSGDEKISYLRLPDTTPEGFGSRWHPGHLSHERAAAAIADKLRELL